MSDFLCSQCGNNCVGFSRTASCPQCGSVFEWIGNKYIYSPPRNEEKTLGHIHTFELSKEGVIPVQVELTVYEKQAIAVVNALLDLFGKHRVRNTFWQLDLFHRQLWFHRAEQILSALQIEEVKEIH